jgi:hypothetical protein
VWGSAPDARTGSAAADQNPARCDGITGRVHGGLRCAYTHGRNSSGLRSSCAHDRRQRPVGADDPRKQPIHTCDSRTAPEHIAQGPRRNRAHPAGEPSATGDRDASEAEPADLSGDRRARRDLSRACHRHKQSSNTKQKRHHDQPTHDPENVTPHLPENKGARAQSPSAAPVCLRPTTPIQTELDAPSASRSAP